MSDPGLWRVTTFAELREVLWEGFGIEACHVTSVPAQPGVIQLAVYPEHQQLAESLVALLELPVGARMVVVGTLVRQP